MILNLAVLKSELATDPEAAGYTGDDVQDAALLNLPRTGIRINLEIPASIVASAVDVTEFSALVEEDKRWLEMLISGNGNVRVAWIKSTMLGMFGAGSVTRTRLAGELDRDGSRAEELALGHVTPSDCADARRLA